MSLRNGSRKQKDSQNPSPAEMTTLRYRDRDLGRQFYLSRRFAEARVVLKSVLDHEGRGTHNRA
jgi:hypothetical protein